ncbi:hypothetical protein PybrP1_012592 [[Pythium] brassicae (nom. inval.)]|nr:hypothetical protein PybrP1_012592 [[Pythium] brassicae (nom. inval.)]
MAKFAVYAAAALCALAGSAQAQSQPACVPLDFTTKAADIKALNSIIDIANNSGLLAKQVPNPITVTNSVTSVLPFSALGFDFEITPIIKNLAVSGVQTVVPKHLEVTSGNSVRIAAGFDGTLAAVAAVRLHIKQLHRKWYQPCLTDILHPSACEPANVDIDADLAVVKGAMDVNTQLNLRACPVGVPTSVCKDVTVSDILIAALQNQLDPLLARLVKRFASASARDLKLGWDSIRSFHVRVNNSGALIDALLKQLAGFSVDEVNKKGDIYNKLVSALQSVFTSVINNQLAASGSLGKAFGNTCYDA